MKEYNIIGDIAGNYNTLIKLLKIMPSAAIPLSVGDMVDRGPDSKKVLDFFINNGQAVLGNHDHMMLEDIKETRYYYPGVWISNGGHATLESYYPEAKAAREKYDTESEYYYHNNLVKKFKQDYPEVLEWLQSLPYYKVLDGPAELKAFVSHAVKRPDWSLETATNLGTSATSSLGAGSLLWNRGKSRRYEGYYQIFGHNSHWGLQPQVDKQGEYGKCIDTSASNILTGIHWPSLEIYQVPCEPGDGR